MVQVGMSDEDTPDIARTCSGWQCIQDHLLAIGQPVSMIVGHPIDGM
jgi:hypothetical protein